MKSIVLFLCLSALAFLPTNAKALFAGKNPLAVEPAQSGDYWILSKQGSGSITKDSLSLTLTSGPNCDETEGKIPDGSRMVSDHFVLNTTANGTGVFYGTVKILSPSGQILHIGTLRGTVGTNDCDPADGGVCAAVCTRPGHLQGLYEPVPTFAPNPNGEIAMFHFKADLKSETPEPLYRASLNGLFAPLLVENPNVQVIPDKLRYAQDETVRVGIVNKGDKTIRGNGPRSANCTILELERQENGQWKRHETICPMLFFETDVRPGETVNVEFKLSVGATPIPAGIYRLVLPYHVVEGETVQPREQFSVSASFQVGDPTRRRIERTR